MSDHKRLAILEARLKELEAKLGSKGKAILQVQKEETTDKVGSLIREAYDAVNDARKKAVKDKAPKETFEKLNQLKKDVPKKYAITKETMRELNRVLNSIVGVNQS